jgi:hypothetical protein
MYSNIIKSKNVQLSMKDKQLGNEISFFIKITKVGLVIISDILY